MKSTSVGIEVAFSSYITINNNTCSNNWDGTFLWVWDSNDNRITNNTCSDNSYAISIGDSNGNSMLNNTCSHNLVGICLEESNNNSISNTKCSINEDFGIYLKYSNNNSIYNNICTNNEREGIYLKYSNNNSISNNNCSNNKKNGICLDLSSSNGIYLNNFMNNTNNVYTDSTNTWNSKEKITYTYNGSTYTNYLGNYWDDYNGTDANNDGIGSTPYSIDTNRDYYPLMEPFENYFLQTKNVFDTGQPKNPYPSISGTHSGTIHACSVK